MSDPSAFVLMGVLVVGGTPAETKPTPIGLVQVDSPLADKATSLRLLTTARLWGEPGGQIALDGTASTATRAGISLGLRKKVSSRITAALECGVEGNLDGAALPRYCGGGIALESERGALTLLVLPYDKRMGKSFSAEGAVMLTAKAALTPYMFGRAIIAGGAQRIELGFGIRR